jgi:hypothetical protein
VSALRLVSVLSAALIATSAAALGAQSQTVQLKPLGGWHERGTAVLVQQGPNLLVKIAITGMPADAAPQLAHIRTGNCRAIGSLTPFDLEPVQHGHSQTTLKNVSLGRLRGGPYVIVIYQAPGTVGHNILCGATTNP